MNTDGTIQGPARDRLPTYLMDVGIAAKVEETKKLPERDPDPRCARGREAKSQEGGH